MAGADFWAGVNTNHRTLVRTKQSDRDPAVEVVSVHFQTNPGAVRLRCESDLAPRYDPVLKTIRHIGPTGTCSVARIMGIIVRFVFCCLIFGSDIQ